MEVHIDFTIKIELPTTTTFPTHVNVLKLRKASLTCIMRGLSGVFFI